MINAGLCLTAAAVSLVGQDSFVCGSYCLGTGPTVLMDYINLEQDLLFLPPFFFLSNTPIWGRSDVLVDHTLGGGSYVEEASLFRWST